MFETRGTREKCSIGRIHDINELSYTNSNGEYISIFFEYSSYGLFKSNNKEDILNYNETARVTEYTDSETGNIDFQRFYDELYAQCCEDSRGDNSQQFYMEQS